MSATENPQRNPYFGELHVHTAWSLDAFVLASLNGPDEAFRYAKGEIASRSSLNNAEENQPAPAARLRRGHRARRVAGRVRARRRPGLQPGGRRRPRAGRAVPRDAGRRRRRSGR